MSQLMARAGGGRPSRFLAGLFGLVAAAALANLLWASWQPYSYWLDEIYSVAASRETFPVMFSRWIFIDVHPPLYQVLLNGWIALFGITEPATRALSVIIGLLVVVLVMVAVRIRRDLLAWSILLLSLPWFAYFGQEVRPYVLLYLLGVVATLAMLQGRDRVFLAVLVLMAWIHYFGLLLGLSLLFARLVVIRRIRWDDVLAGALMLVWLPLHLTLGSVLGKAGHFWIQVDGPGETLANLLGIVSPGFTALWKWRPVVSVAYAAVILAMLAYFPLRHFRRKPVAPVDLWLSLGLLVFIVGIVVVDQIVPMSTPRNFLVAMPAFLCLLARVAMTTLSPRGLSCLLVVWVLPQLTAMGMLMHYKHSEFENYRRGTTVVLSLMDQGYTGYYLEPCEGNQGYNSDAMNNLYMDMLDVRHRKLAMLCRQDLQANLPALAILACQQVPGAALPPGYMVTPVDAKGMCQVIRSRGDMTGRGQLNREAR